MSRIEFRVNGKIYSVGAEISSDVTLLDYLRETLNLRGTKYMCAEGSCGACIVAAARSPGSTPVAVNSCLVSILSCRDWNITTIEGIGNRHDGYHTIQKTLAEHNGSQCGYCSPGWVMAMYSLLKDPNYNLTKKDIEKSFGSNICRCTGYRSILDAFKTFAKDSSNGKLTDIEDLRICDKSGMPCKQRTCSEDEWCFVGQTNNYESQTPIQLKDNKIWYIPNTVNDVLNILKNIETNSYMLVAGNTAKGVYTITDYPDNLIDISAIEELKGYKQLDAYMVLGTGNTLTEMIGIFKTTADKNGFNYLSKINQHLESVGNIAVRNIATIGGSLMLKHDHAYFPSDIFVLLEAVAATLIIMDTNGITQEVTLKEFLNLDMSKKIITSIKLPALLIEYFLVTYKISLRAQNAKARVNAAFLYKVKSDKETVTSATIVFGGISSKFVHATQTESYLVGKQLFRNTTLQQALNILQNELVIEGQAEENSPNILQAKEKLALGIFYKALLELCPSSKLKSVYKSGAIRFNESRPVSSGKQSFGTNPGIYPLNQPMPKLEALIQCAGEAPYVDDEPSHPQEVFAAFVLSTVSVAEIERVDPQAALNLEGVIAFYEAKDIPGKNSFTPLVEMYNFYEEEEFCNGKVKFHSQPIGVIVAKTEYLANKAAKMVQITYKDVKTPVLTIENAKKDNNRVQLFIALPASGRGTNTTKVIKGSNNINSQYHYHIEKQVCLSRPSDDGIEVLSSTEWMETTQIAISQALNLPENCINMSIRRLGGGFGAKLSRAAQIAVACSLVTLKLNRQCRMILPMTTNMKAIGKRLPCSADFEVGVNRFGEIQYMDYSIYDDNGYAINEPFLAIGLPAAKNCYSRERWNFKAWNVTTDTAKNSWAPASGTFEMISMIEYIMERISYEMSLDPIQVRITNLSTLKDDEPTREIIENLKSETQYEIRRAAVLKFNSENRWKKRGLRFVPVKWPLDVMAAFNVSISVHHGDGNVVITHGGVEMGQGINTKVAQVCAYTLNISMDKIKVKATNNITNINGTCTNGSYTSEIICFGVIKCCQILLDRLAPIKIMIGGIIWDVLVKLAYSKGINLVASYSVSSNDLNKYNVYGATLAEVEVDVLTGEQQVVRVDILEDIGQSISPEIDVGQVEGAFVMGMGYWLHEELIYDQNTGELLTDRAWNYYVPQARDIPQDFRVYFKKNSYSDAGTLGAKACAEPALCMAMCVPFALREAIAASRKDSGVASTTWFNIDGAYTLDKILLAADVKLEEFKFN